MSRRSRSADNKRASRACHASHNEVTGDTTGEIVVKAATHAQAAPEHCACAACAGERSSVSSGHADDDGLMFAAALRQPQGQASPAVGGRGVPDWVGRAVFCGVWAGVLGWLLASGAYLRYLRPEFAYLLAAAGLVLVGSLVILLRRRGGGRLEYPALLRLLVLLLPAGYILGGSGSTLDGYALSRSANPLAGLRSGIEQRTQPTGNDAAGGDSGADSNANDVQNASISALPPELLPPQRANARLEIAASRQSAPVLTARTKPVSQTSQTPPVSLVSQATAGQYGATGQPGAVDAGGVKPEDGEGQALTLLELYQNADRLEGKRVCFLGMVSRNPEATKLYDDQARLVFRFLISCCTADAQALSVVVREGLQDEPDNTWLRVSGVYHTEIDSDGRKIPLLQEVRAVRTPQPASAYMY